MVNEMLEYIYGTKERIFINTTIGCAASCSYCYLPSIHNSVDVRKITGEEVIEKVMQMKEFVSGKENTILSIGCYSECMFNENIQDTMKVISFFLKKENYIQLATKQIIPEEVCKTIIEERVFKNQINIYISLPTFSKIGNIEVGTASLTDRINNIRLCKKHGINVILYIKPFLETVTLNDLDSYINLIKEYSLPVVVGSYLSINRTEFVADVGETLLYEGKISKEMKVFINELSKYTDIYLHSIDYIKALRKRERENESNCNGVQQSNYNSVG